MTGTKMIRESLKTVIKKINWSICYSQAAEINLNLLKKKGENNCKRLAGKPADHSIRSQEENENQKLRFPAQLSLT